MSGWSIVCGYLPGCHQSSYFNAYKALLLESVASERNEEQFFDHVYDEVGVYIDNNSDYTRAWAMVASVLEIGINTPVTVAPMTATPTSMSFLASNSSLRMLANWKTYAGGEHLLYTPEDLIYCLLQYLISHSLRNSHIRRVTAVRLDRNLEDLLVIWAGLHDDLRYFHNDPIAIDAHMVYFRNNEMYAGLL